MLVLTRRVGEGLMIGDDVVVRVLEVKGDVVRIGVDAPREVKVHREEVFAAVAAANRDAVGAPTEALDALREAMKRPRA